MIRIQNHRTIELKASKLLAYLPTVQMRKAPHSTHNHTALSGRDVTTSLRKQAKL